MCRFVISKFELYTFRVMHYRLRNLPNVTAVDLNLLSIVVIICNIYIYIYILLAGWSGIESRWGRDFPHPSKLALGPTQPPIEWVPALFPGGKAAGAWR
jgi:hypothetical protein